MYVCNTKDNSFDRFNRNSLLTYNFHILIIENLIYYFNRLADLKVVILY